MSGSLPLTALRGGIMRGSGSAAKTLKTKKLTTTTSAAEHRRRREYPETDGEFILPEHWF